SGATAATFTISLAPASKQTVNASWATSDGTAVAPADYTAGSGTVTFAPGETSKTVAVNVAGDTVYEASETFFVDITAADVGGDDGHAIGTIVNDDSPPSIVISDVTMFEGNSGTTPAVFT